MYKIIFINLFIALILGTIATTKEEDLRVPIQKEELKKFQLEIAEDKQRIIWGLKSELPFGNNIYEILRKITFQSSTGKAFIAYASLYHDNPVLGNVRSSHIFKELKAGVEACKQSGSVYRSKDKTTTGSADANLVNVSVWQCKSEEETVDAINDIEKDSKTNSKVKELIIIFNDEFTDLETTIMSCLSENTRNAMIKIVSKDQYKPENEKMVMGLFSKSEIPTTIFKGDLSKDQVLCTEESIEVEVMEMEVHQGQERILKNRIILTSIEEV